MIRVSVLLSSYNGEKYIAQQIKSIIEQKGFFDLKIIIRDDGSKDNTRNIIKKLQILYPQKIDLICAENVGCNAAFFELLRIAPESDYYSFSDQDDFWLEDKIQSAINMLEQEDATIPLLYASTSYLTYDDFVPFGVTRGKQREISFYNSIVQSICPGHTQVMNKELVTLLTKKFDYNRMYVYDSWISNVANLFGKIIYDNNPHTYYRQHQTQQMGYGKGVIGRLKVSANHALNGDGKQYRKQIEYFFETYKEKILEKGFDKELMRFLSPKTFFQRLTYVFNSKLYRQSRIETLSFYFIYVMGKY